ncbi:CoA pyrophosphatase [Iodidimonas sp. MBR-22]|uniref:CoA pyrophosphatase n=1 Tax=unclassified Iodidimonas TaxID=2626145 RepID=UPI0032B1ACF7
MKQGDAVRRAAVLVPIIQRAEGATILLTRRAEHLSHHAGQISFPGGRADEGDANAIATALRETHEEVGLTPDRIDILGRLDSYETVTGFRIVPVVGMVAPPFDLRLDAREVADAFEVPLDFILDSTNHQRHSRMFRGQRRHFYAMPYQDFYIWGATAHMLVNLAEVLGDERPLEQSEPKL